MRIIRRTNQQAARPFKLRSLAVVITMAVMVANFSQIASAQSSTPETNNQPPSLACNAPVGGPAITNSKTGTAQGYLMGSYCPTSEFAQQKGYSPMKIRFGTGYRVFNPVGPGCLRINKFELPTSNPLTSGDLVSVDDNSMSINLVPSSSFFSLLIDQLNVLVAETAPAIIREEITLFPDVGRFWNFSIPCKAHNYCYNLIQSYTQTLTRLFLGVIKENCDSILKADMESDCSQRPTTHISQRIAFSEADFCRKIASGIEDWVEDVKTIHEPVVYFIEDRTNAFDDTNIFDHNTVASWPDQGNLQEFTVWIPVAESSDSGSSNSDSTSYISQKIIVQLPSPLISSATIRQGVIQLEFSEGKFYIQSTKSLDESNDPKSPGTGFSILIKEAAQKTYRLPMSIPTGIRHEVDASGKINFFAGTTLIAEVRAPRAFDFNGVALPSTHRIENNNEFVITVDARNAVLPAIFE